MADHKFPEGVSKIVGPDGKTHYRLNAEPAEVGAHGTPLGKGVAQRPSTEEVKPKFRVVLDFGKGPEHVAVYTPEEILNPQAVQFEKKRLLATCLVAQSKQVHTVAAPSGRGEVDQLRAEIARLREKNSELENQPRKRLWFVVTPDGSEAVEATSKDQALTKWNKSHPDDLDLVTAVNEVTVRDLTTLLELNEEGAAAKRMLAQAIKESDAKAKA